MAEDNKNSILSSLILMERAADRLEKGMAERPFFERVRSISTSNNLSLAWLVLPMDKESLRATLTWLLEDAQNIYEDIEHSAAPITPIEVVSATEPQPGRNTAMGRGVFGSCTLLVVRDCAAVMESGRVLNRATEHFPVLLVTGRPDSVIDKDFEEARKMLANAVCARAAVVLGDGETNWPAETGIKTIFQVASIENGYQPPLNKHFFKREGILTLKQRHLARQLVRVMVDEVSRRRESINMRIQDSRREKAGYDQSLAQCDLEKKSYEERLASQIADWKAASTEGFATKFSTEFTSLIEHGKKGIDALNQPGYPLSDALIAIPPLEVGKQITDLYRSWLESQGQQDKEWLLDSSKFIEKILLDLLPKNSFNAGEFAGGESDFARQLLTDDSIEKAADALLRVFEKDLPDLLENVKSLLPALTALTTLVAAVFATNWAEKGDAAIALKSLSVGVGLVGVGITVWLMRKKRITSLNTRKVDIVRQLAAFSRQVSTIREKLAREKLSVLENTCRQKALPLINELINTRKAEFRRWSEEAEVRGKAAENEVQSLKDIEALLEDAGRLMQ